MEQQPSDSSLYKRLQSDRADSNDDLKLEATTEEVDEVLRDDYDDDGEPDNPAQTPTPNDEEADGAIRSYDQDEIDEMDGTDDGSHHRIAKAVGEHDEALVELEAVAGVEEMMEEEELALSATKTTQAAPEDSRKTTDTLFHSDLEAEPIIPVASARIIPVEEPVIRLTALAPIDQDEENAVRTHHPEDSSQQAVAYPRPPPRRIASRLAQRVMLDEDGSSARHLMADAMQSPEEGSSPSWKSKKTFVLILVIATVTVIAGVVVATVVVLTGEPVDDDFLPPTKAPNRTTGSFDKTDSPSPAPSATAFLHAWSVEEFGYPDIYEGKTYPWGECETLQKCVEYCEFISNGLYEALAYVSVTDVANEEGATTIVPEYPTDPLKPDCYCYQFVFCMLDYVTSDSNGTVLSKHPKPPNCVYDDDVLYGDDNVTESISIGNNGE